MLQESSKQQLVAYNHLVEAILSMTDTEVRKVTKIVPKPDIGVPHNVLQTFDKYGDVNFRHMLDAFLSNLQLAIQTHHKFQGHC